ncbi:MAG: hypothetical protein V4507_11415 [Verrucomicrobiota bacterium]
MGQIVAQTYERSPKASQTKSGTGRGNLETAQDVVERGLRSIQQDLGQGSFIESEQALKTKLKTIEQQALEDWASQNNLILNSEEFNKNWLDQGEMRGREHFVYYEEKSNQWIKKNNLAYHDCYSQYFLRLFLHNQIFPETPYELMGFIQDKTSLFPVVSQQTIRAIEGASHEKVAEMMKEIGFKPVPKTNDAYLSEDGSIEIKDLHDQNALVTPSGKVSVIDPLIRILDEYKAKLWLKERGMTL